MKNLKQIKLSFIIPAFNEEKQISKVLQVLISIPFEKEIIVVDDGSKDRTSSIVKDFQKKYNFFKLIRFPENRGKGAALMEGIKVAKGEIFVFLDADLVGLTPEHIKLLIKPILEKKAKSSLGVFEKDWSKIKKELDFKNLFDPTLWASKIGKSLSGIRAIDGKLAKDFPQSFSKTKFGIEVAMNQFLKERRIRILPVKLISLTHLTKEQKRGFFKGFLSRVLMYFQIIKTLIELWNFPKR